MPTTYLPSALLLPFQASKLTYQSCSKVQKPPPGNNKMPMNGEAYWNLAWGNTASLQNASLAQAQDFSLKNKMFKPTEKYPTPTMSAKPDLTRRKLIVST